MATSAPVKLCETCCWIRTSAQRWDPESAAGGVALHAARVRTRLEPAVPLASDRADAAERPRFGHGHVVPAPPQLVGDAVAPTRLERERPAPHLAREERRREMVGAERGRVDRGLEVVTEDGVPEERVQRPLVLRVAAGRPEGEIGLAVAEGERRRERGARALARREG